MTPVINAPAEYTPVYCDTARLACAITISDVEHKIAKVCEKLDRLDGRIFTLLLTAIIQLLAVVGGMVGIWLTNHQTAMLAAETVVKAVKP
jgi:hypothetical protein